MNQASDCATDIKAVGVELCEWLEGILAYTTSLPTGCSECWGVWRETKEDESLRSNLTPICVNGGCLDDVQVISEWEYRHKASDGSGYVYW